MNSSKDSKVLIFLDYFTPAYKAGGPIRIFEAVARDCGRDSVMIVTQDQDWGESQPLGGIVSNTWSTFLSARVFYASIANRKLGKTLSIIKEADCGQIHLNSFFSRTWTFKVLLLRRFGFLQGRKVFLSPHGELAASALAQKSLKKAVFLKFAKAVGLMSGIEWIATSTKEVDEIKFNFPNAKPVHFLPPPLPQIYPHADADKSVGRTRIVFLARLSAMKNIGFLLRILPRAKGMIELDIFGPIDPDFAEEWAKILTQFQGFDSSHKVNYRGPVPSVQSAETLARYDLFIQPSLTENFGYSIVEALASGTPVLISDQTPWNCVNDEEMGAALSLSREQEWVSFLDRFTDLDARTWQEWSSRAQLWISLRASTTGELLKIYSSNSFSS